MCALLMFTEFSYSNISRDEGKWQGNLWRSKRSHCTRNFSASAVKRLQENSLLVAANYFPVRTSNLLQAPHSARHADASFSAWSPLVRMHQYLDQMLLGVKYEKLDFFGREQTHRHTQTLLSHKPQPAELYVIKNEHIIWFHCLKKQIKFVDNFCISLTNLW